MMHGLPIIWLNESNEKLTACDMLESQITLYRSNTYPNAIQPQLYEEPQPQAQQYYYYGNPSPRNPNREYYKGGNLPPVQDFYDTFR